MSNTKTVVTKELSKLFKDCSLNSGNIKIHYCTAIYPDGTEAEFIRNDAHRGDLKLLQTIVGGWIDLIPFEQNGEQYFMAIDDEARLKPDSKRNNKASQLVGSPILGTVIIWKEEPDFGVFTPS